MSVGTPAAKRPEDILRQPQRVAGRKGFVVAQVLIAMLGGLMAGARAQTDCAEGNGVPDVVHKKKNQPMDIRPMFVGYRQVVDGLWFPAYTRVDDTLHFQVQAIHIREIVKFTGYKRAGAGIAAAKP